MLIAGELRNANRAGADQPSSHTCRIITIFQDDGFWRLPERIRQHDEVPVGCNDCEAVLFCEIPNLAIRSATGQANLGDVNRTWKEILYKLHQLAGEIFIKKELHLG